MKGVVKHPSHEMFIDYRVDTRKNSDFRIA